MSMPKQFRTKQLLMERKMKKFVVVAFIGAEIMNSNWNSQSLVILGILPTPSASFSIRFSKGRRKSVNNVVIKRITKKKITGEWRTPMLFSPEGISIEIRKKWNYGFEHVVFFFGYIHLISDMSRGLTVPFCKSFLVLFYPHTKKAECVEAEICCISSKEGKGI